MNFTKEVPIGRVPWWARFGRGTLAGEPTSAIMAVGSPSNEVRTGANLMTNNQKSPKDTPRLVLRLLYGLVGGEAEGALAIVVLGSIVLAALIGKMLGFW